MLSMAVRNPSPPQPDSRRRRLGLVVGLVLALPLGRLAVEAAEAPRGWRMGEFRDVQFRELIPRGMATQPVKIDQVAVVRSNVRAGDQAALEAVYTVAARDGSLTVRETRTVEFNGTPLATKERVVSRRNGQVRSEVPISVPEDAVPGAYTVTTIVSPITATVGTAVNREQTMFIVEAVPSPGPKGDSAGAAAGPVPSPPVGTGPSTPPGGPPSLPPGGDRLMVQVWSAKSEYRIGEKATFFFQTNRDAYVTLINKGTSGKVTVLYPNPYAPEEQVKAGTRYTVPTPEAAYELPLSGPVGEEMVWAVATLKPIRPGERGSAPKDVSVLTRDINVQVSGMPPDEQAQATVVLRVSE